MEFLDRGLDKRDEFRESLLECGKPLPGDRRNEVAELPVDESDSDDDPSDGSFRFD